MLLSTPLVLWTVVLTPLLYFLYNVVIFLLDVRRRGKAVDQFPGEPKHWLWGHLHLFPGPNEAGLRYYRNRVKQFPRGCSFWYGGLEPSLTVQHFELSKLILRTSGPTDVGLAYFRSEVRLFPRARAVWLGPVSPVVSTRHSDTASVILQSSEPKPIALGSYGFGKPWIGDGLLLSQGQKWARNRRLLTPAFHFDILKPYMKVNNECSDMLVNKIASFAESGESFEFYSNISLYTFDVILRCAMSYETDIQTKGESHPYVLSVTRLSDIWVDRVLTPWKHFGLLFRLSKDGRDFKRHCDYVHSVSEEVITKRQQTLTNQSSNTQSKKKYLDFLDILIQAKDADGKGLTFTEIRDEVDTFMFEGHDTTASAISWLLYSLGEYPEHQKRCQDEIDEILQGRDSDDILWDDLPKLKFLNQCIKEAMRLHCPVPFISRSLTKDMVIDGKTLPKNSIVDIQIYNLHHNPTVWEKDMEFIPSRFDPDKVEKMDSFAFVPFSAGPRNCIGQNFAMHEIKTVVARLLRRYNIAHDPDFKVHKKVGVVMRTTNGMKMKVSPRQK